MNEQEEGWVGSSSSRRRDGWEAAAAGHTNNEIMCCYLHNITKFLLHDVES